MKNLPEACQADTLWLARAMRSTSPVIATRIACRTGRGPVQIQVAPKLHCFYYISKRREELNIQGGRAMKKLLFAGLAIGCLISGTTGTANALSIDSDAQGWVNSAGSDNGSSDGNNTFTGNEYGARYNSWAQFDLSGVSSPIASATLELELARWPSQATEIYTLDIFDATTKTYTDLMTGNIYGSVSGNNGTYTITLSNAAISDINANLGGMIIFGFTNATLNLEQDLSGDLGIYINGFYGNPNDSPILHLSGNASPVPEPTTMFLFGTGIATLAAISRSRRKSN
jgi:hypothetical protein